MTGHLGYMNPALARTQEPTPRDFLWSAGFYEGDGNCIADGHGNIQVYIPQKDAWAVDRMQALFGGSVNQRGTPTGPVWYWRLTGARARGFLQSVYGLLSPRRQAQIRRYFLDG